MYKKCIYAKKTYKLLNLLTYVLFTHETESWFKDQWYQNAAGWGEHPSRGTNGGNDLVVTKRAGNRQAIVFMHELGHNLGLFHSQEADGSDSDPDVNPTGSETVYDTVMYWSITGVNKLDYLLQEWDALELRLVRGGD